MLGLDVLHHISANGVDRGQAGLAVTVTLTVPLAGTLPLFVRRIDSFPFLPADRLPIAPVAEAKTPARSTNALATVTASVPVAVLFVESVSEPATGAMFGPYLVGPKDMGRDRTNHTLAPLSVPPQSKIRLGSVNGAYRWAPAKP